MSPTGIDQSWGQTDPKSALAAGVRLVSMYLSWDPSKNLTLARGLAYLRVGIGLLFNWESQAGAPLKGAAQGKADATEAVRLTKLLLGQFAAAGFKPNRRIIIYFSCDRDVTPAQYAVIAAYYRAAKAVCAAAGFGIGVYGEAALVSYLHQQGITDAEWQTYAWSGGVLSPDADFFQYLNGQTLGGASVDFDRIIHADQLGALWPPTSQFFNTTGGLHMDADVAAQFAAINKKLDSLPVNVWNSPLSWTDPTTKKVLAMRAGSWVIYGNRYSLTAAQKAGQALTAATSALNAIKAAVVTVDTAAVAADIKAKLLGLLS